MAVAELLTRRKGIGTLAEEINTLLGIPQHSVGAWAVFTKGFGRPDDWCVGSTVNRGGGIATAKVGTTGELYV